MFKTIYDFRDCRKSYRSYYEAMCVPVSVINVIFLFMIRRGLCECFECV